MKDYRCRTTAAAVLAALILLSPFLTARVFAGSNIPVTIDIPVTYIVNGNDGTAGGDEFTLTPDDPAAPMPDGAAGGEKTISITGEGSYSFGEIHYDRPDIYWYTVTRNVTEKKGVVKDDSVYRAKVIALNDGHGYVLVYKDGSDEKHELIYTDKVAPATGDGSSLLIYLLISAAAALAFAAGTALRRKNRKLMAAVLALALTASAVPLYVFAEADGGTAAADSGITAEETDSGVSAEEEAADTAGENAAEPEEPEEAVEPEQSEPAAAPVLRAANGTSVSYTSWIEYTQHSGGARREVRVFKAAVDGKTFEGVCAQLGTKGNASGTATITKVSNSSRIAKIMYHYGVELGWWRGAQANESAQTVMGLSNNIATTKRVLLEYASQIYHQSKSDWMTNATGKAEMSTAFANAVYKCITTGLSVDGVTVPDSFEMYYCDAGSGQDFSLWNYTPPVTTGFVKVKKISADQVITGTGGSETDK